MVSMGNSGSTSLSLSDSRTFCVTALILGVTASAYISRMKVSAPPSSLGFHGAVPVLVEVAGRLQNVCVAKGSLVHAGDVVIQLDTRDLLLKKNDLESQIHSAEVDGTDTPSKLSSLYGELQHIQVDLGRLTITSPTDGKIVSLPSLHRGEMLQAGSAVAVVVPGLRIDQAR